MAAEHMLLNNEYHLTPLQEGMLLHSVSEQGIGMYFNQVVYNMENLDVEAMRIAWSKLIGRYEILRSSFHWENISTPFQRVEEEWKDPVQVQDWSSLSTVERQKRLREYLRKEKETGFDFSKAPLIRVTLIRCTEFSWLYIFSHHHLLLDGWSKNQVNSELKSIYEAAKNNKVVELAEPIQFRNYIDYLKTRGQEEDRVFWREYLKGASGLRVLPGERSSRLREGYRMSFGEWNLELDNQKKSRLIDVARECRVTLNSLIVGVWAILLSRYNDSEDVLFGMLVSGRPPAVEGIDKMVGMFLNAIPVRIRVEENLDFKSWIQEVQKDQTSLKTQEQTPLRSIQEYCGLPTGKPLYECILVNTNTVAASPTSNETAVRKSSGSASRAIASSVQQNVPLHLDLETIGSDLVFKMTYDARRFKQDSVVRVMEQFSVLLDEIVNNPGKRLGDIQMMSAREYELVKNTWNSTTREIQREYYSLDDIFTINAGRWGERVAVIDGDRKISYSELEKKSREVAKRLAKDGLSGKVIGISIKRSINACIGIIGILRAGATYVPLDPFYPKERLEYMIRHSGAENVLVSGSAGYLENVVRCLDIESLCDETDGYLERNTSKDTLESIAYILYTSGSTGQPKGIGVPHRVAVNRLTTEPIPVIEGESFCAKTSLSFVDSIWEMFTGWMNGCPVTIIPEEIVPDIERFIDSVETARATRVVLVPSLLRSILDADLDLSNRLPSVRYWISSGEKLTEDLSSKFGKVFRDKTLINIYGTSEVWDVTAHIVKGSEIERSELPIGKPMGNVQCYVVDNDMRLVPIGIRGRLLVGGDGVADGYWNNTELTEERFIASPFSEGRLYRTGDIARWLPDGSIELVGREDTQVKIRGYRIELEEIESTLRDAPLVNNVVVWIDENEVIAAGLLCNSDDVDLEGLRKICARSLPDYMIPNKWYLLKQIPKNPNGKVDRLRVKDSIYEEIRENIEISIRIVSNEENEYVEKIRKIWEEILGSKIATNQNVFRSGAHSLTATRAAIRIGKELGRKIPLKSVFENPTPSDLASWLVLSESNSEGESELPEIRKLKRSREEPLSYNQRRLWFLYQLDPTSVVYTVPNSFELDGALDTDALNRAFHLICERHESLRTRFISKEGVPYQVISEKSGFELEVLDVTGLPEISARMKQKEETQIFMRRPWNLLEGPLVRAKLINISEAKSYLLLAMHHIITDGHSMGIIADELQALYKSFSEGREPRLPSVELQYADYSRWEAEWMEGKAFEKCLAYWKKRLEEIDEVEIPLDFTRNNDTDHLVDRISFSLNESQRIAIEKIASETESTIFMVLLSGFQIVLGLVSGQSDVHVGTPVSNRDRAELQKVIGLFVNTVMICTTLDQTISLKETIQRVRKECIDAFANIVPFDKIVDELKPPREVGKNPLFQVMYVHQNEAKGLELGKATSSQVSEKESSDFDLLLITTSCRDRIDCTLQYRRGLFKKETIGRFADLLRTIFIEMAERPSLAVGEVDLVSETERRQLLAWGQGKTEDHGAKIINSWLRDSAKLDPDSMAVEDPDNSITYAELELASSKLAAYILTNEWFRGENVIGLCFEKEINMLIALFGILKSGKAVMAIDPEYPHDRISMMLEEASCKAIITQKALRSKLAGLLDKDSLLTIDESDEWNTGDHMKVSASINPEDLAYISFTSGSTGKPKAVLVEHRNVVAMVEAQLKHFEITKESRVLQVLSVSFDAGLAEIFRCVAAGGSLILMHRNDILPGDEFIQKLEERQVSVAAIPPVMLAALPADSSKKLTALRTVITGGEACQARVARIWAANRVLIIGYGTTETANGTLFAKSWDLQKAPPLGKPLDNTCVYILNESRCLVPAGVPGDIYIGGKGVSRGYLNRDELNQMMFVLDPYILEGAGRMYATGDRGRWLSDGSVEFLGRKDNQVKIRGHRIELNEINETIQLNANVKQCVSIVSQDAGIKRLFSYVISAGSENKLKSAELRAYAKDRLPEYMVPAAFIVLRKIPVTPSGKVDYRSLPKPNLSALIDESVFIPPNTENEIKLASIWCKILGLERISADANFFEFGGDSILSVQVVAQATKAGVPITVKDLFEHQTLRDLAKYAETASLVQVDQAPVVGDAALTPIQHWFFEHSSTTASAYNHSMIVPVPRAYTRVDVVEEAIRKVWDHHDILRSRFERSNDGKWIQRILETGNNASIRSHDISDLSSRQQSDFISSEIQKTCSEIDIESGPISKVLIFRRRDQKISFIGLVIHHLLTDIVSWQILVEDFQASLRYVSQQLAPVLPEKTTSYRDWSMCLERLVGSGKLKSEEQYWISPARRAVKKLPLDDQSRSDYYSESSIHVYALSVEGTRSLIDVMSRDKRYTVQIALLSTLSRAVSRWSGNDAILIDVEGHGREEANFQNINLSRTVGWFTSFYPLLVRSDGEQSAMGWIEKTGEALHEIPNKGLGYGVLRYLHSDESIKKTIREMPQAQIAFNYIGINSAKRQEPDQSSAYPADLVIGQIKLTQEEKKPRLHDLEIIAGISNDQLSLRIGYNVHKLREESIIQICELFEGSIKELLSELG